MNRTTAVRKAKEILHKREQRFKIPKMAIWYQEEPKPEGAADLIIQVTRRRDEYESNRN